MASDLFAGDPSTPADLARLEALIAAEEELADEADAEIKALEETHGIEDLKKTRKGHKDEAEKLMGQLRAAVKAGAVE